MNMNITDWLSAAFLLAGAGFFCAGTIALLRFPDVYTRLHALSKIDNLGLGFTCVGLLFNSRDASTGIKIVLVWLLVLVASAAVSFLIARRAQRRDIPHWRASASRHD